MSHNLLPRAINHGMTYRRVDSYLLEIIGYCYSFSMTTAIPLPKPSFSESVAANVRALAAAAGFSQSSLGRAVGLSQFQAHKRWMGSVAWTLDELPLVADALGVSVSVLIEDFIPKTQNPDRWIAPSGAAARPKGLEPPTF